MATDIRDIKNAIYEGAAAAFEWMEEWETEFFLPEAVNQMRILVAKQGPQVQQALYDAQPEAFKGLFANVIKRNEVRYGGE